MRRKNLLKNLQSKLLLTFLFYLILNSTFAQEYRILFLGNSYTEYNNLPQLIQQMAQSTGNQMIFDKNTPGGYTLKQHSTNAISLEKIYQGNWDFVVLQDQSQYPAMTDNFVQQHVYPYAKALDEMINDHNPCVETIFYNTWGRKNGDQPNCADHPAVCTYEGMDDLLQERYTFMANENEALLSPVAQVWRKLRATYPEIELYTSDESHPSLSGSYAAAVTFYTVIWRKDPTQITFNSNLNTSHANQIKQTVKEIVYDHLWDFNVGKFDPKADFSYAIDLNNGIEVSFQNASTYAEDFIWEFGDGTTSTETHPTHIYQTHGNYQVKLIAKKCETQNVKTINLRTNLAVNDELISTKTKLKFNPVQDFIELEMAKNITEFQIVDVTGKLIKSGKFNLKIDVKNLPSGNYVLNLKHQNQQTESIKFIKK